MTMRPDSLSLEAVLDEPVRFGGELAIPLSAIDREPLLSISPLKISGEVRRIEGGYTLDAELVYSGELECSRCLAGYPFQEDEAFSLVLYPRTGAQAPEVELSPRDLDVHLYDDPVVPLAPLAEERVQMALPMKPLCRPDCKGLCPSCGKDLNLGACGCTHETIDPRWEALKALKEKV
jgi:DUF177 domain-containing protein